MMKYNIYELSMSRRRRCCQTGAAADSQHYVAATPPSRDTLMFSPLEPMPPMSGVEPPLLFAVQHYFATFDK
jgi:hypothetical protein